jgi:hypothetical protein
VPGVWRAHVDQDRSADGITGLLDSQRPAVRGANCALHTVSLLRAVSVLTISAWVTLEQGVVAGK